MKMKAITQTSFGDPNVLEITEVKMLEPVSDKLIVKVESFGINRADIMQRRGIGADYYVQLGQGSYDMVLKHADMPHIRIMRDHFEFLAEVVYTSVRLNGEFRSMWE